MCVCVRIYSGLSARLQKKKQQQKKKNEANGFDGL